MSRTPTGVMRADYSTVTEAPGTLVSREAMDMVWTRYAFGSRFCEGRSVLEVGCGPGAGLAFLAGKARRVVGGDYTHGLLRAAQAHSGARVPLVQLDAGRLPFRRGSFDVVLLFEAVYFLPDVDAFLDSCRDVLTAGGTVLVVTVNPAWKAFNPAPMSTTYPGAEELVRLFAAHGFAAEVFGGFPAADGGWRGRAIDLAKRSAVALHLIPKTMKGKEWLKRVAFGRLYPFPARVSADSGTYHEPVRLERGTAAADHKVLYVVARKEER